MEERVTEKEKYIIETAVLIDGRKRLTCEQACTLSKDHNLSLKEIGDACNEYGIKIIDCQLGCFK